MKILRYCILLIVPVFMVVSCTDNSLVYEQITDVKSGEWSKDESFEFTIPVTDSTNFYNLVVFTRNRNDYSYSNLYLFIDVVSPLGATVTDTLEYKLANEHGEWLGKNSSKFWDNRFAFRNNIRFPITGNYVFTIRHGMRENNLHGINNIGLRLENLQHD